MFTLTSRPAPSYHTYLGVNHSRMTEAMERLGAFAFLALARLRRIVGDGAQIRMDAAGCRGAARLLECSPASVYRLLTKMAEGGFVRWWLDDAGHICLEVLPPCRPPTDHAVIALPPEEAPARSRRDRGRAVPPLDVLTPSEPPPADDVRSRGDRTSIHDHVRNQNHELASSEPIACAAAGQPGSRATEPPPAPHRDESARTPTPPVPAPPPPADPRVVALVERGVYEGLARRLLEAQPALTLAEFDRQSDVVARRGKARLAPPVIVASILARGEQVDEATPTGYGGATPTSGERVSDLEITLAPINPRDRQDWQSRFRNADSPEAKRRVLERFRAECPGAAPTLPRSA